MGRQPSVPEERSAAQGSLRQLSLDIPRLRTAPAGHRDLDAAAMRVR